MRNKYLLTSVFFVVLSGGAAAEEQPANQPAEDGMVLIPAGEFLMGSSKEENLSMWREANALNPFGFNDQLYANERPAHKVNLPAFLIDKYEVSNAQYRDFAIATQHPIPTLWKQNGYSISNEVLRSIGPDHLRLAASTRFNLDMDVNKMTPQELLAELERVQAVRDTYPVTTITWSDAVDYCSWAGKHLPSEAEWEKAARGPENFEYPWGNQWDPKKINTMASDADTPYSPIGSYPGDKSAYGVYDMAANVAEWVSDWYDAYPGAVPSDTIKNYGKIHRVVRGGMASAGHYDSLSVVFRAARRSHFAPDMALMDVGFRCVKDVQ